MLPENVPVCPFCGNDSFKAGGGTFGPGGSTQHFTCLGCDANVVAITQGGRLLSYIKQEVCIPMGEGLWQHPESWISWVENCVIPAWKFRYQERKAFENKEFQQWLKEVLYPRWPELYGRKAIQDGKETSSMMSISPTMSFLKKPKLCMIPPLVAPR